MTPTGVNGDRQFWTDSGEQSFERATGGGREHPRVRGEQLFEIEVDKVKMGPSPRARGADEDARAAPGLDGTIPACEGSSTPPRPGPGCGGAARITGCPNMRAAGPVGTQRHVSSAMHWRNTGSRRNVASSRSRT